MLVIPRSEPRQYDVPTHRRPQNPYRRTLESWSPTRGPAGQPAKSRGGGGVEAWVGFESGVVRVIRINLKSAWVLKAMVLAWLRCCDAFLLWRTAEKARTKLRASLCVESSKGDPWLENVRAHSLNGE